MGSGAWTGKLVVIGASTGGLEALRQIFGTLNSEFPWPMAVCQHMERSARLNYGMVFSMLAPERVREVEDKDGIRGGRIYFAPPDYHLYVEDKHSFSLSVDNPVNWSRPSIDILFESAGRVYGSSVICIVLTGSNADGTAGARFIKSQGGEVLVQDPNEALAPTMPQAAIASGCADRILDLQGISQYLNDLSRPAPRHEMRESV